MAKNRKLPKRGSKKVFFFKIHRNRMTEVETPDESSRESRPLFIERYWSIVSTCQVSSVPQLTGTEET